MINKLYHMGIQSTPNGFNIPSSAKPLSRGISGSRLFGAVTGTHFLLEVSSSGHYRLAFTYGGRTFIRALSNDLQSVADYVQNIHVLSVRAMASAVRASNFTPIADTHQRELVDLYLVPASAFTQVTLPNRFSTLKNFV